MAVYNTNKFFAFPNHIETLRNKAITPPVHIRIKPINACNHSCWFCAYRAEDLDLGEDMKLTDKLPQETMTDLVTDIIELGVKAVTFSGGGEPLLYKNLDKHIERLATSGIKIGILTNGSFLRGELAKNLAKYCTWIRVSTDAWSNESLRESRKVKIGEYDNIINNMADFKTLGGTCSLGVSFIVGKTNYNHINEYCLRAKEIGVDHVKVAPCIVSNDPIENEEYHKCIRTDALNEILVAQKLNDENFSVVNHYHSLGDKFQKSYSICPFRLYLMVVGADSKVYTCQDKAYTQSGEIGNLKNEGLKALLKSKSYNEEFYSFDPRSKCKHHCVANQKNLELWNFLNIEREHLQFV